MHMLLMAALKWFVERQLLAWGRQVDWEKVRADAKTRIAALVPGTYWDDAAVYLVDVFISVASAYFVQPQWSGATDQPAAFAQAVHDAVEQRFAEGKSDEGNGGVK